MTGEDEETAAEQLRRRRATTETEMGGVARLEALRLQGRWTVRDRISAICDDGTFTEVGTFAHSDRRADHNVTPGDGKIGGHALVSGRPVTVIGDDITVKRGSSSRVGEEKVARLFEQALFAGNPFVYFGEAGGARIPDIMEAETFTKLPAMPWMATRQRLIPTATAIVGDSFGASSLHSTFTDFVVQVRGSCLAITSPRVIEIATGESITMEELGGVDIHDRSTGQIDLAVDSDADAIDAIRQFLDLMPSNAWTAPERATSPGVVERDDEIEALVPVRRRRAYDMRTVLRRIVDDGALLELRPGLGQSVVTALGRIDGFTVGIIASNPMFQAGAISPDACDKGTRLLCLCDAFDIPVIFLQDTPGFLVGKHVEHDRLLHRASRMLQALTLCGSPRLTVIVRKSFGMAFQVLNGTGMGADSIWSWPGAEIGFMDPEVAANVVFGKRLAGLEGEERAAEHQRLAAEAGSSTSPYDAAGVMSVDEIIDPATTRSMIARRLGQLSGRRVRPHAERRLAGWPMC